jgi:hypothetical protein
VTTGLPVIIVRTDIVKVIGVDVVVDVAEVDRFG